MPEANIVWFAELFTHMLVFYCVRDTLATTTGTTQLATPLGTANTASAHTASSSYLKPIIQSSTTLSQPSQSATLHNSDPSPIKSVEYNRDSARTRQMLEARMRPTSSSYIATINTNTTSINSSSSNINVSYTQPPQPPNRTIPFIPTATSIATTTSTAPSQPEGATTKVYTYTQPPPPPPLPIAPQVNYPTSQPMQLNRKSATPSSSTSHTYPHPSYTATPHTPHTPFSSSSYDPFYLPSLAFPGIHQFFYRYILLLHTHTTFTMHLKDAILSSIDALCDISWEHIDMLDLYNPTSTPHTSHTSYSSHGNNNVSSMQRERISYTHHILKLKLLGRFLGVAEFSHRWNNCSSSSGSSSSGGSGGSGSSAHIQPTDTHTTNTYSTHTNNTTNNRNNNNNNSNKSRVKRSTGIACLPLKQYLLYAYKTSNLCLYIPWIIEFLRMSEWDSSNGCLYAYIEVLGMLKEVQGSVRFRLPLDGSGTGVMSSNRYVYCRIICYVVDVYVYMCDLCFTL